MTGYLNSYHNAAAADSVLAHASELARVVTHAHQAAVTQLIDGNWDRVRKYFSLSEKYAAWADYHTPAVGSGIHAYAATIDQPLRLTDAELRSHPRWRGFGVEAGKHPPMRGWLVCPLLGADHTSHGFIQVSDRIEGDFTASDEADLLHLAALTAAALDALKASSR
jgi:GAF domain-containing protein